MVTVPSPLTSPRTAVCPCWLRLSVRRTGLPPGLTARAPPVLAPPTGLPSDPLPMVPGPAGETGVGPACVPLSPGAGVGAGRPGSARFPCQRCLAYFHPDSPCWDLGLPTPGPPTRPDRRSHQVRRCRCFRPHRSCRWGRRSGAPHALCTFSHDHSVLSPGLPRRYCRSGALWFPFR